VGGGEEEDGGATSVRQRLRGTRLSERVLFPFHWGGAERAALSAGSLKTVYRRVDWDLLGWEVKWPPVDCLALRMFPSFGQCHQLTAPLFQEVGVRLLLPDEAVRISCYSMLTDYPWH